MTIRRDDLAAAAALGLLQYRQIDPLLVFLLQRDVVARRQAMLEQTRVNQQAGLNKLLSWVVGLLAIVTAALFGILFATRVAQSVGPGAVALFFALYLAATLGVVVWFRRRGYWGRARVMIAVVLAAAPLAVVALQQVAS